MGDSESISMLAEFPKWLASTSLRNQDELRPKRWAAISAIANVQQFAVTEGLIRLAFKSKQQPEAVVVQTIRQVFYDADNTFDMKGNDEELRVLAASALAARLTLNTVAGAKTALALRTALVEGHRAPHLPMDLNALSSAALQRIAESNGKRPNLSIYVNAEAPKVDFSQASAKAKEGAGEPTATAFTLAADAMRGTVNGMAMRQRNAVAAVEKFLRIQDEELQMLWWLVGQRSFDMGVGFSKIALELKPLIMAKELAGLTAMPPGPRALEALLFRAGITDEPKIGLTKAIAAVDEGWAKSLIDGQMVSAVTTPLHSALQKQQETGKGNAWIAGWAAVTEISDKAELSPIALALQFYRERLLILSGDE